MSPAKQDAKKHVKAIQRRRLHAKERHAHQQRQAQRAIDALHQALHDVGVPADLVIEIEGRLRAQKKLLGKIFGLMFPTLFGCRSVQELTRTRGWDKNMPSRLLAQAPAEARPRYPLCPVAPCRIEERHHPQSLAVDLGMGRHSVPQIRARLGTRRPVVQWAT
jgi:hypothetical protein